MACGEVFQLIDWLDHVQDTHPGPQASCFFTRHFGFKTQESKDAVHYGSGSAVYVSKPKQHLYCEIHCSKNTENAAEMVKAPGISYVIRVFVDEANTLTFQETAAGIKFPEKTVMATCVNDFLLSAAIENPDGSAEVVTIGFARKAMP